MTTVLHDAFPLIMRNKPPRYPSYGDQFDPPPQKRAVALKTTTPKTMTATSSGISRGASFVVGQKLRESKWFRHDELKVFLAVVESGFVVERESEDEDGEGQFGIALWKPGCEKSKAAEFIQIYSLGEDSKGKQKVRAFSLFEFWPPGSRLRINNKSDKDTPPHKEETIRSQIDDAMHFKQKWHNSQHFVYWCRYETPQVHFRIKQISDSVKWANIGINTGLLMLKKRKHSKSESK